MSENESPSIQQLQELSKFEALMSGLLGQIIEQLPDPLVVVDSDGKIVLFNREAELFFGWPRDSVLRKHVEVLIPAEVRERHVTHREGFAERPRVRGMGVHGMELTGLHRSGRLLDGLAINLSPIITQDGLSVVAVIRRVGK